MKIISKMFNRLIVNLPFCSLLIGKSSSMEIAIIIKSPLRMKMIDCIGLGPILVDCENKQELNVNNQQLQPICMNN